jgi:DNA-binding NarL/FixJ family response regulator
MSKTAIVIDDDFDSVEIFCMLLEEKKISVIGKGYNGKEAIDLYREKKPDLVFLDLGMPDGTGFHAIRNIKKINDSAKIIPVTGINDSSTKEKLDKLNIHDVILKPIDMDKLTDLVL